MADFQQKPNTFTLFPNDYKKSDNHPDWRGKFIDENGKEWQMSGWVRTSNDGKERISGNIQEPWNKDQAKTKPKSDPVKDCPQPESTTEEEDDSELPF